jgi:hypothetical protein
MGSKAMTQDIHLILQRTFVRLDEVSFRVQAWQYQKSVAANTP